MLQRLLKDGALFGDPPLQLGQGSSVGFAAPSQRAKISASSVDEFAACAGCISVGGGSAILAHCATTGTCGVLAQEASIAMLSVSSTEVDRCQSLRMFGLCRLG